MAQAVGPTYAELVVGEYTVPIVIVEDDAMRTLPPDAWAVIPAGEFPIIIERTIARLYFDFPADQE